MLANSFKLLRNQLASITDTSAVFGFKPLTFALPLSNLQLQQSRHFKTKKRRKRYPFFWLTDKYRSHYDENLTKENEEIYQEFLKNKYNLSDDGSPLKNEPWPYSEQWHPGIRRTGVIAKKLGHYNIWTKECTKITTTLVQVLDNHVISYRTPEEFEKLARPVDRNRYNGLASLVVGCESGDPRYFTAEYNGLFSISGLMPKKKLTRFMISPEARLEPGTPLFATHFRPGMFVNVYGRSIERGLAGVRDRYHLKLGGKSHGVTKQHNRIGSIGRGRKECGPLKGRRMPGHDGGERVLMPNIKIWRINTEHNLIWLNGPAIPGDIGSYIKLMDSRSESNVKVHELNPPPFPTISYDEHIKLDKDLYDKAMHCFEEPTIIFEETEEERRQAALLLKQGKAKTAQKFK